MTAEGSGRASGAPEPSGLGVGGGTHDDLGVSVERDLAGSGRLARGGSTRFSTLRFHSRGLPAPPSADADRDEAPRPALPAAEAPRPSLARRLLRWLGLG
jgi:hypothetical protein